MSLQALTPVVHRNGESILGLHPRKIRCLAVKAAVEAPSVATVLRFVASDLTLPVDFGPWLLRG